MSDIKDKICQAASFTFRDWLWPTGCDWQMHITLGQIPAVSLQYGCHDTAMAFVTGYRP